MRYLLEVRTKNLSRRETWFISTPREFATRETCVRMFAKRKDHDVYRAASSARSRTNERNRAYKIRRNRDHDYAKFYESTRAKVNPDLARDLSSRRIREIRRVSLDGCLTNRKLCPRHVEEINRRNSGSHVCKNTYAIVSEEREFFDFRILPNGFLLQLKALLFKPTDQIWLF